MTTQPKISRIIAILLFASGLISQVAAVPAKNTLPSTPDSYRQGIRQLQRDNPARALTAFKKAISDDPGFTPALIRAAETFLLLNQMKQAEAYFDSLTTSLSGEATLWYAKARLAFTLKSYQNAANYLRQAIELDPNLDAAYGYKVGIAEVFAALGDLDSAVDYLEALRLEHPKNARIEYGLARCFTRTYNWPRAMQHVLQAIRLDPHFLLPYHTKIYIHSRKGEYKSVLETALALDSLATSQADTDMLAYAKMMLGNVYFRHGDYLRALKQLREALLLAEGSGDLNRQGACHNSIAATYAMIGKPEQSLHSFQRALRLADRSQNTVARLRALLNIGNVYLDIKDPDRALQQYNEVLGLAQANHLKFFQAQALTNIAETRAAQGENAAAQDLFMGALTQAGAIEDQALVAYILNNLASIKMKSDELGQAIELFVQAQDTGQRIGDAQIVWEAASGLGAAYQKSGEMDQAIRFFGIAVAEYENVRKTLAIQQLNNDFLEDKYQAYPSLVRLLAARGDLAQAFDYAEKYKAKMLLDFLSSRQLLWDELLPDALGERLHEVNSEIARTHSRLRTNETEREAKLLDLGIERAHLLTRIENESPRYFDLVNPKALSAAELQHAVLGPNQAVVEYIVGSQTTSVFLVTSDSVYYDEINLGREVLRDRLSQLSGLYSPDRMSATNVRSAIAADFKISPAFCLYTSLLKPLRSHLDGVDHLVIIPDDWLHYLPFEMLITDTSGARTEYDFRNATFLVESFQISYAQSASLLAPEFLRMRGSGKKGILALGNPGSDLQLRPARPRRPGQAISDLPALPAAEVEVGCIADIFGPGTTTVLRGAAATESAFKALAPDYNILHLATHFLNNDQEPLYSNVVLARTAEENEDGNLHTYEIFNMHLNAGLAVLSACNTGGGKLFFGEGLVGIYRAFLFAGTPSLLVATWNVDDAATAKLMSGFYRHLAAGANKASALRQAKLDFLRTADNQKRDPYYWAPFVLIGNWEPMNLHGQRDFPALAAIAIALIAVASIFRKPAPEHSNN